MFVIRKRQLDTLTQATSEEFLLRMDLHLRAHFEPIVGHLNDLKLREFTSRNWEISNDYGLTSELGVCSYLEAACILGEDFPVAKPWAKPLLEQECSEADKLDRLNEQVLAQHFSTVAK